ncbi:hypothetical protein KTH_55250 [Thermosporothrix hazakensis]|nr:hypothetical protein KTH_55250 [Thermosporothrix hazakensis]
MKQEHPSLFRGGSLQGQKEALSLFYRPERSNPNGTSYQCNIECIFLLYFYIFYLFH